MRSIYIVNILCLMLLIEGGAYAVIEHQPTKKYERKGGLGLTSELTHKRLKRAHKHLSAENYAQSLSILKELETRTKSKPHEYAQVLQTYGYVYAQKDDYKNAVKSFEKCLELQALPESAALLTMYTLSQLYLAQKDYKKSIGTLKEWFAMTPNVNGDAYILMASVLSEIKDYKSALPYAEKAVIATKNPKEHWLQFLLALQYEMKKFKGAKNTLNIMVEKYPKEKKYWVQLANLYVQLEQQDHALVTLQLAEEQGYLDQETEILNLVSLYLDQNIPFFGAKLLKYALEKKRVKADAKAFEVLAGAWQAARELDRSIEALQKAFKISPDGPLGLKLSQLYVDKQDWKAAKNSIQQALSASGWQDKQLQRARAYITLGISSYYLKDKSAAKAAFEKAVRHEDTSKMASSWLNYIQAS